MSKTYRGERYPDGQLCVDVIEEDGRRRPLDPRRDLFNHSLTGFECGYAGSGPAQLALAILADRLGDHRRAVALHQAFKEAVVATLPQTGFTLPEIEVRAWLLIESAADGGDESEETR